MYKNFKKAQPVYRNQPVQTNAYDTLLQGEAELERMYPPIYFAVYPEVVNQCNEMQSNKGEMYVPSKDEFDSMVNSIQEKVQSKMSKSVHEAQFGGFFGDLIGIIFLGELLGRRRRRRYGYRQPYGYRRPYGRY